MGLDVYFRKIKNLSEMKLREAEYERRTENVWGDYNKMTEAEKETARATCKAVADELGLDEYGSVPTEDLPETASSLHPDHMFNLGYWRSSYNSGGINSMARARGLPDLYDIMQPPGDEYYFKPDWKACLERAEKAVKAWREAEASPEGQFWVSEIQSGGFGGVRQLGSPGDSARITAAQVSKNSAFGDGGWSCSEGEFYPKGLQVVGVRLGEAMSWNKQMVPTVHLVCRGENGESPLKWYREAIEIVHETILHMMQRDDVDQIYVAWSG